jgi:hypothetical protein
MMSRSFSIAHSPTEQCQVSDRRQRVNEWRRYQATPNPSTTNCELIMNIKACISIIVAILTIPISARADRFDDVQRTVEESLVKNCRKLLEPNYLAGTFQLTDVKETAENDSKLKAEGTGRFTLLKIKHNQKVTAYLGLVLDRMVVKKIICDGQEVYSAR